MGCFHDNRWGTTNIYSDGGGWTRGRCSDCKENFVVAWAAGEVPPRLAILPHSSMDGKPIPPRSDAREAKMSEKPKPVRYTVNEGGEWFDWQGPLHRGTPTAIHSVMFEDGSIFDTTNGWRQAKYCIHCGSALYSTSGKDVNATGG